MSTIAVLHRNGKACDRLRRAVATDAAAGAHHRLEKYDEWDSFADRLRGTASLNSWIGVIGAYHSGAFMLVNITQLIRDSPRIPILIYSDFSRRPAQHAGHLALAGVSRLITLDVDDHLTQIRDVLAAIDSGAREQLSDQFRRIAEDERADLLLRLYDAVSEAMSNVNSQAQDSAAGLRLFSPPEGSRLVTFDLGSERVGGEVTVSIGRGMPRPTSIAGSYSVGVTVGKPGGMSVEVVDPAERIRQRQE